MPDRDWVIIIILGIGWGGTFFFNEVLLRDLGPVSVSAARVSTAALFCWVYAVLTGRARWPGLARLPQLAIFGTLMFGFPFAIYPVGQQFVTGGVAGIVNALTPVLVVIVSHFWPGGERATVLKSLGVLAGFVGIVFLTIPAIGTTDGQLFGTLFLVLAPVCYGIAMNYIRRLSDLDVVVTTSWSFTFAGLLMMALAGVLEGAPGTISVASWASIAFLGCVLTGVSFLVAFTILPRAGATKTSTVTFVAPVSALFLGYVLLSEEITALHLAGMAAIFLGLLLIDGRLFRRGGVAAS